jgi:DNA-binding transcriptional MocR family regulator
LPLALRSGGLFGADDLIITAGATQALRLALHAVCQPGDAVAIEQPAYFGTLLLLEDLGLKALQIPTDPIEGLLLAPLEEAIQRHRPAAVLASRCKIRWVPACPSRASGAGGPACRQGIPLIEDDVYGDLAGGAQRPPACKAFDRCGNVIYCSSLSKPWRRAGESAGLLPDAITQRYCRPAWPESGQARR